MAAALQTKGYKRMLVWVLEQNPSAGFYQRLGAVPVGRRMIDLGGVEFLRTRVAVAELKIFETWNLTREPALVIGMDALGTLDMLIIDYRRRELQIRVHPLGF